MKTSILIPTFKRTNLLRYNLESLLNNNKLDYEYEIIILDEYFYDDEMDNLLNEYSKKLNLKHINTGLTKNNMEDWRIPGFAFNIGAKKALGDILILCSAEIFHINNDIDLIVKNYNENRLLIPLGYDDDGTFLENKTYKFSNLNTQLPFCMGLSKEVYIEIGGFDEDFLGNSFDDNDLIYRLKLKGLQYYNTGGQIVHLYHKHLLVRNMTKEQLEMREYNQNIYLKRKGIIVRNQGKSWGEML